MTGQPAIRLHHCHQTRSMRTLWLLHELGLDFDLVVYPFDKSLRDKAYLALHPVGRVPSLEVDDKVLIETGAIAEVLCEMFSPDVLGRRPGDPERADWLIWLHFAESVSQHTAALTQQHIALYDDTMRSPVVMKLEAKRLAKCCAAIDARLEGRLNLLDTGFTAADIGVGQAIYMAQHFVPLDPFRNLARWYDSLTERPAFRAALPPDGAAGLYARAFYPAWEGP